MNEQNKITRDEVKIRVLRLLDNEPKLSQREISNRLGVSLGSVNFCVKALVQKGWVKVNNFRRNDNKLGYAYVLTPHGVSERASATKSFLLRKVREYEHLKDEISLLQSELNNGAHVDSEPDST